MKNGENYFKYYIDIPFLQGKTRHIFLKKRDIYVLNVF